jgi:hypothetical protein
MLQKSYRLFCTAEEERIIKYYGLKRTRKEGAIAYFKALLWNG